MSIEYVNWHNRLGHIEKHQINTLSTKALLGLHTKLGYVLVCSFFQENLIASLLVSRLDLHSDQINSYICGLMNTKTRHGAS